MDDLALLSEENQGVRVKTRLEVSGLVYQTRLEAPTVGCDFARETTVLKINGA